jgi:pSer/pThr/pTyr-binding forkhead associated (FHA) protein
MQDPASHTGFLNHELLDFLQVHAGPASTGCLRVRHHYTKGSLWLYQGRLVHAETEGLFGLPACHAMLSWPGSALEWEDEAMAEIHTLDQPVDVLLFGFFSGAAEEPVWTGAAPAANEVLAVQIMNGAREGTLIEITRPIVSVGADERCELCLPDPTVSRSHGRIQWQDGRVVYTDLNSRNGSRLNNHPFHTGEIQSGDYLHVGQTLLHLQVKLRRPAAIRRSPTEKIGMPPSSARSRQTIPLRWEGDSRSTDKRFQRTQSTLQKWLGIK